MPGLMDLMGFRDDSDAPGLAIAAGGAPAGGLSPLPGGQVTAGPVRAAPGPMPAGMAMPQAPQRGFWDAFRAGAVGPAYADKVYQGRVQDYRNQMVGNVLKSLFQGRDQYTPITWQDVQQAAGGTDPGLLGNKRFLAGMGYIMQDWNSGIAKRTKNQFDTARLYGAEINDPRTIQNFQRFGYLTPGQGQARQNPGGLMDLGQGPAWAPGWGVPQPGPQAATAPRRSAKETAFPGAAAPNRLSVPRDADLKFGDDMRTYHGKANVELGKMRAGMPLALEQARLKARAGQEEQTIGHMNRRKYDQATPPGQYVTRTDPATGRQYREWSGGAGNVDLGRAPQTLGQMDADLVRRGLEAYRQGKKPEEVLNPGEYTRYESAMKGKVSLGDAIQLLFGDGAGLKEKKPPQAGGGDEREREVLKNYPNAQKGEDGNWYVIQDGKRYRVEG